jgi:hypothetical protein
MGGFEFRTRKFFIGMMRGAAKLRWAIPEDVKDHHAGGTSSNPGNIIIFNFGG